MTSGRPLFGLSAKVGFVLATCLTMVCALATLAFAFVVPLPSMELGFAILTFLLLVTAAFTAWSWTRSAADATGPASRQN